MTALGTEAVGSTASVQSDYDKIRRMPFLYAFNAVNTAALLCTIGAPLALFATELGIEEGRIGVLAGLLPFAQLFCVLFLPLVMQFSQRIITAVGYGVRHLFLLSWFAAPWLPSPDHAFWVLFGSTAVFALFRTLAETAIWPWSQEYLPRQVRGRVNGMIAMVSLPVALAGSVLIQFWLDGRTGIERYFPVFAVGIVLGLTSVLLLLGLKGGQPRADSPRGLKAIRAMRQPMRDGQFWLYLYSSGTQLFAFTAVSLFLVLFFRDRLGLSSGQLVTLAAFIPLGGAVGSVIAGWFVDRYGTRAIRVALQGLQVALLLSLLMVSGPGSGREVLAAAVFFMTGLLFQSSISAGSIYLLNYVPPAQKENYMTLAYASDGLIGGGATVLAGAVLQMLPDRPATVLGMAIDNYDLLFVLIGIVVVTSAGAFTMLREEGATGLRTFFGYFSRGSAIRALLTLPRYRSLASEERRQELTYSFGGTGSAFVEEELISALSDASFDVRYEATQSLGHLPPSAGVVRALQGLLRHDGSPELQYAALTSLGRLKAKETAPLVAQFLLSSNLLLRARAIRTIGQLGEKRYLPPIRDLLQADGDLECRLAAASALGKFRDAQSVPALLALYWELSTQEENAQGEQGNVVLLALSKILGFEEAFSGAWRAEQRQTGPSLPRLAERLARRVRRLDGTEARALAQTLTDAAENLGTGCTSKVLDALQALYGMPQASGHPYRALLLRWEERLAGIKAPHHAFIILALLSLERTLTPHRRPLGRPAGARAG